MSRDHRAGWHGDRRQDDEDGYIADADQELSAAEPRGDWTCRISRRVCGARDASDEVFAWVSKDQMPVGAIVHPMPIREVGDRDLITQERERTVSGRVEGVEGRSAITRQALGGLHGSVSACHRALTPARRTARKGEMPARRASAGSASVEHLSPSLPPPSRALSGRRAAPGCSRGTPPQR